MAIAHVCVQCGWDLARVRPHREPHYGLNLIRCPNCQAACVRRKHPIHKGWRQFRRIDFALTMLFVRVLGIASLTFFCVMGGMLSLVIVTEPRPLTDHMREEAKLFLGFFYILVPLVLGTFLTASFAHKPVWKVWLGWLAWMAIVTLVFSVHGPIDSQFDSRAGLLEDGRIFAHIVLGITDIMLPVLLAVSIMLIAALPGIVLGKLLLRLRDILMRAKWRWRSKKLRLAGAANV